MPPDAAHAAFQQGFHAALWEDVPPVGLTAPDPGEVARRFAVYRNNVHHSLAEALGAHFPVVRQLVGDAFFAALARVFIADTPPANPVLQEWGGGFPDFIDAFPPVAHLPWLGDVARLEFARGQACHAADAAPVGHDALAVADPERLRLGLHPSVGLFASPQPVVSIWNAHQPGANPAGPLAAGAEYALIGRQPDFSVIVAPLDPGTHAVLAALAAGTPLGDAATLADPTPALTLLLRHQLIIAAETGEPS